MQCNSIRLSLTSDMDWLQQRIEINNRNKFFVIFLLDTIVVCSSHPVNEPVALKAPLNSLFCLAPAAQC